MSVLLLNHHMYSVEPSIHNKHLSIQAHASQPMILPPPPPHHVHCITQIMHIRSQMLGQFLLMSKQ